MTTVLGLFHRANPNPRMEMFSETLLNENYNVEILCWNRGGSSNSADNVVPVTRINFPGFNKSMLNFIMIPILYLYFIPEIFNRDPDVILCGHISLIPLAVFIRVVTGTPVIYDAVEFYKEGYQSRDSPFATVFAMIVTKLEHFCLRMVDGITVIDTTNDVLLNRYSGYTENTSVIYNVPNFKPIKKSEDNDVLEIVYVGLIDKRKGVHVLLEAFNKMLNTHDVKLVLIGGSVDNTLSELRKRAEELGIQDKIQFVGRVEYNAVHDYLCSTDIAVAPYQPIQKNKISRWNSRKIPDYMNASLPIVGPNYGGFAEIIKDTNCGIVVDTTDQIALAEGLRSLLDNPEKRKEYGENGREAIKSQYNWEQESSKLLHLVENALNNVND